METAVCTALGPPLTPSFHTSTQAPAMSPAVHTTWNEAGPALCCSPTGGEADTCPLITQTHL